MRSDTPRFVSDSPTPGARAGRSNAQVGTGPTMSSALPAAVPTPDFLGVASSAVAVRAVHDFSAFMHLADAPARGTNLRYDELATISAVFSVLDSGRFSEIESGERRVIPLSMLEYTTLLPGDMMAFPDGRRSLFQSELSLFVSPLPTAYYTGSSNTCLCCRPLPESSMLPFSHRRWSVRVVETKLLTVLRVLRFA